MHNELHVVARTRLEDSQIPLVHCTQRANIKIGTNRVNKELVNLGAGEIPLPGIPALARPPPNRRRARTRRAVQSFNMPLAVACT